MDEMRHGQAVGEDSEPGFSRYAFSCGLLLLPAIAWNLAFTSKLMPPSAMSEFWRDIPGPLTFIENLFRVLVFGLPFAMPLRLATTAERRALLVFVFGTLAYFASWLALMYWPHSARSTSVKRTKVETVVWVKLRISRIRLVSPEILFS